MGHRVLSQEEVARLRSAACQYLTAEGLLATNVWPGASCQVTGSPLQEVTLLTLLQLTDLLMDLLNRCGSSDL